MNRTAPPRERILRCSATMPAPTLFHERLSVQGAVVVNGVHSQDHVQGALVFRQCFADRAKSNSAFSWTTTGARSGRPPCLHIETAIAILRQWQEDCGCHFAVQRNRVHLQHCHDSAVHGTVAVVSTSFARQRCSQQHSWHDSAVLDIALVAKRAVAGTLARASRARQRGARLRGRCLVIMDAH